MPLKLTTNYQNIDVVKGQSHFNTLADSILKAHEKEFVTCCEGITVFCTFSSERRSKLSGKALFPAFSIIDHHLSGKMD